MEIKLKKRIVTSAIVLIVVAALILSSFFYLNSQNPYSGKVEAITIGIFPNELNSLIYIADYQHHFAANGLNVTIKNYTNVLSAVDATLNGEVDISTASEFVLAGKALTNQSIKTIASIDKVLQVSVIGLRDRGIANISDLAGKKIGVFFGSAAEFYLGRFLELNGIKINQVTLVDTASALNVVDSIANGTYDAVVTGQPNIDRIKTAFGNEVIMWSAQSSQLTYYNAICKPDWVAVHPELVKRFLSSLAQAENYVIQNPTQSKHIIQSQLNYSDAYITDIWPDHQFSLSLDQSLILAMQDESRWLIQNNLINQTATPSFLPYIYVDGLKTVKPESVNILR